MSSKPKLKPHQRVVDFPNEGLAIVDGNLYCNFCDCNVSWSHKSDVAKHIKTEKHEKAKKIQTATGNSVSDDVSCNPYGEGNSQLKHKAKRQRSMGDMVSAGQKKNELIGDLITIFAVADIPLQKVDAIRPFLRKHISNGGSIPGSSQLRETHLPRLMPQLDSAVANVMKDISSLNIILDETTDNTNRVVLDILFKIPAREKPILVATCMLDANINHRSLAQCVVEALGKYQIPLTKGVVDSLVGDGAAYIKKAYTDILQPLVPDLLSIWCLSHQLNLVGEKWRDHPNNSLMKKYMSLMNSMFSHSTGKFLR